VLQQAVATETVEAIEAAEVNANGAAAVTNGYGNGNGNGNGNGAKTNGASSNGTSTLKVIVPAAATAAAAAAAPAAAAAMATSNGNGKAAAAATSEAERMRLMNTIDEEQNAEAAGQLELAAATANQRKDRTAAGTPYKAPGGNWSKFKTYSVWQVGTGMWVWWCHSHCASHSLAADAVCSGSAHTSSSCNVAETTTPPAHSSWSVGDEHVLTCLLCDILLVAAHL
jgi:hypothetical protein